MFLNQRCLYPIATRHSPSIAPRVAPAMGPSLGPVYGPVPSKLPLSKPDCVHSSLPDSASAAVGRLLSAATTICPTPNHLVRSIWTEWAANTNPPSGLLFFWVFQSSQHHSGCISALKYHLPWVQQTSTFLWSRNELEIVYTFAFRGFKHLTQSDVGAEPPFVIPGCVLSADFPSFPAGTSSCARCTCLV